jgi:hypothetical protein
MCGRWMHYAIGQAGNIEATTISGLLGWAIDVPLWGSGGVRGEWFIRTYTIFTLVGYLL